MTSGDRDSLEGAPSEDAESRGHPAAEDVSALQDRLIEAEREIAGLKRSLHQSESRYRLIVDSAVDYAIIATDLGGIVTTWNDAAEAVLGWSERQIVGRPIATIFTPEDVEDGVPDREMRLSLTMGKAQDERWHIKADGSRFFASGEMMPLYSQDGTHAGFLKILRDRTREVLERKELQASRERLKLALDASALVGTWDWDIPGDRLYADARFAERFGVDPVLAESGTPLQSFVEGIHPDDRDRVARKIAEAVESVGLFAEEYRVIGVNGEIHWLYARGRCFADPDGRPVRFPGAIVDMTAEKARETRQAALLKLGDQALVQGAPGTDLLEVLQLIGQTLDVDRVGYAGVDPTETYATILREWTATGTAALSGRFRLADFSGELVAGLRSGVVALSDTHAIVSGADPGSAWDAIGVRAMVNIAVIEDGKVRIILYVHSARPRAWQDEEIAFIRDVLNRAWSYNQRRQAERALVETEARLRLAQEAAGIGTFDFDLGSNVLLWDDRCRAMFGVPPGTDVTYDGTFLPGLHPDDRPRTEAAVAIALDPEGTGLFDIVYRTIGLEDGILRHVHARGQTLVEDGRTVRFVGAVRDVTQEVEAVERQRLLARELHHRVKNTLAVVNAIANQTLRRATDTKVGLEAFSARLSALGQAHDILTQTSWTSAPIEAIVGSTLKLHRPADEARLAWSGPEMELSARQGLALSLAMHELATNAVKYGALSNETGRVAITWRVEREAGGRVFALLWEEIDGPAVVAPARKGFGSRLIEQSLVAEFGGEVTLDYRPEGLVCTIRAPLISDRG
ncbi:PAS domain-containing protein [Jiella sp. M17.18]|uniref:PAS domain-containing sensor histidine kinase n=1 Tax=Jiella sp. M17.18 TaxID=3234247 RepID=UPI0034DE18C9